jgi:hypothetical protein
MSSCIGSKHAPEVELGTTHIVHTTTTTTTTTPTIVSPVNDTVGDDKNMALEFDNCVTMLPSSVTTPRRLLRVLNETLGPETFSVEVRASLHDPRNAIFIQHLTAL